MDSYWPYATTLWDYIRRAMPEIPAGGELEQASAVAASCGASHSGRSIGPAAPASGPAARRASGGDAHRAPRCPTLSEASMAL